MSREKLFSVIIILGLLGGGGLCAAQTDWTFEQAAAIVRSAHRLKLKKSLNEAEKAKFAQLALYARTLKGAKIQAGRVRRRHVFQALAASEDERASFFISRFDLDWGYRFAIEADGSIDRTPVYLSGARTHEEHLAQPDMQSMLCSEIRFWMNYQIPGDQTK